MEHFRVGESVAFGWRKFKAHVFFLWIILGITWGVSIFFGLLGEKVGEEGIASLFVTLGSVFVGCVLQLGVVRIYLDLIDQDKEDTFGTLLSQHRLFWRYLGASILYGIIAVVGILFFIVPGIYFIIKYQFFPYLIVDKNLGVFDALKKSGEITKDVKWKLLGFSLVLAGLNLLGVLALLVGLLVTVPMSVLAYVAVYRALSRRLETAGGTDQKDDSVPVSSPTVPESAALSEALKSENSPSKSETA